MITESMVLEVLKNVQDPDLHRDIVSLGFVKDLSIDPRSIRFKVELTTPACPVKDRLRDECIAVVKNIAGNRSVEVEMTAQVRRGSGQGKHSLQGVKHLVAVSSGKGGVGKSTVAANLAIALQESGAKVGLMDADVYGPSIKKMLNVDLPVRSANNKIIPPEAFGIKIISAAMFREDDSPIIMRGPMISGMVQQFATQVDWDELDYLVMDFPPGTGDIQLTLCQTLQISGAVVVTTPQEIAALAARKGLNMFLKLNVPVLGVIENFSYFICDQCQKEHSIFQGKSGEQLALESGTKFLGRIPIENQIAESGDQGCPIVLSKPASSSAKIFKSIAGKVAAEISILGSLNQEVLSEYQIAWKTT